MATVFFSYSHHDEAWRDRLETHLAMLKRQGIIETWHDRRIAPGAPIDTSISAKLDAATVILLLVSPDFLASDYCYDVEMRRAMERHGAGEAVVIPVILRPCDWSGAPFGRLKALPRDGKPVTRWDADEAFLVVTTGIKEALRQRKAEPSRGAMAPPTSGAARDLGIRSTNLRVAKVFSERDKDEFLQEAFEYIAKFFENSLDELGRRNPNIEGRFKRIDGNRFTSVAYRNGKAVARCSIWLAERQAFGGDIGYADDDSGSTGRFNESLSVDDDDQGLYLTSLGLMSIVGGKPAGKLTMEGGAELLWSAFIEPLQRK